MGDGSSVIGIIPVRFDSQRLPGKALRQSHGMPLLGYVIERAKRIPNLDQIWVATTDRPVDDTISKYARAQGLFVFRGDTDDVAYRLLECSRRARTGYCVRLNGDSPFPDAGLIGEGIRICMGNRADFVTNLVGRTFPYGVSVEIISVTAFEKAYRAMQTREEREHVTPYFYSHKEIFDVHCMTSPLHGIAGTRLAVDTEDDWRLFEQVVAKLGKSVWTAGYREIAELYQRIAILTPRHVVPASAFSPSSEGGE
jgi:spore coat polysaccharide biosynthesis protein SpsF